MTNSSTPAATQATGLSDVDLVDLVDLPDLPGLTDDDAARVATALSAARTESTRAVYAHAWSQWERWCATRGAAALPADPGAVCAYLAERAENGITVATLNVACSAIGHVHRQHGLDDPIAHPSVRQVRLGLRRTYGIAPRRQARPLGVAGIRQILTHIDTPRPSEHATPRSSCSASPAPCAVPSSPISPSPTSSPSPPACC
ncbi:MAG: hypothetical protein ABI873_12990 [Marmoricola sp.]